MKLGAKEQDLGTTIAGMPYFDLVQFECTIWDPSVPRDAPTNILHAGSWAAPPVPQILVEMKHDSALAFAGMMAGYTLNLTLYLEAFGAADPLPVTAAPIAVNNPSPTLQWDYPEVTFDLPALAPGVYKAIVTVNCTKPLVPAPFDNVFHGYFELGVIEVEP